MELGKLLAVEHSRANRDRVIAYIGSSQTRFDELMSIFFGADRRQVQLASWPLSHAVLAHPELIGKHWNRLLTNLEKAAIPEIPAVKRNSIRLMQEIDLPRRYHGRIMDLCFRFIGSPTEQSAVKAFALTVLGRLAEVYPEITNELRTIIESRFDNETAAFRSRARRWLDTIENKTNKSSS